MTFVCLQCGNKMEIKAEDAMGKTIRCTECTSDACVTLPELLPDPPARNKGVN